jgi:acylphosphatase
MQRIQAIVHGRVQGVGFRFATFQEAQKLGVKGWVRNLPDGTVETVAEGERPTLEQFITYLHQGPWGAKVTKVDVDWLPATDEFTTFETRH